MALAGGAIGVTTNGGNISFSSTINSNPAQSLSLTAGAGGVSVGGVVGTSTGSVNQLGGFTVVSAATVGLASVFTTGAQSVTGTAVTLNGPATYESATAGAAIGFTGAVALAGGAIGVTTNGGNIGFSSTINSNPAQTLSLTAGAGGVSVWGWWGLPPAR